MAPGGARMVRMRCGAWHGDGTVEIALPGSWRAVQRQHICHEPHHIRDGPCRTAKCAATLTDRCVAGNQLELGSADAAHNLRAEHNPIPNNRTEQ